MTIKLQMITVMNKRGYRRRQIMILGFEWQIDAR